MIENSRKRKKKEDKDLFKEKYRDFKIHHLWENTVIDGGVDTQLFKGVCVNFNGYQDSGCFSQYHLMKMVLVRGGNVARFLAIKRVTHIIATQLSAQKLQKYLEKYYKPKRNNHKIYIVQPSWITDSVQQNKKMSENDYLIVKNILSYFYHPITFEKDQNNTTEIHIKDDIIQETIEDYPESKDQDFKIIKKNKKKTRKRLKRYNSYSIPLDLLHCQKAQRHNSQ